MNSLKVEQNMKNRFFDVNKSIYLNGLYILVLLKTIEKSIEMEKLLIGFYFMKYPKVLFDVAEKNQIKINTNCFQEYDLDNIETNMLKFSMRIHTEGLYDALSYLYSKDIISYSGSDDKVSKGLQFENIDFLQVPEYLIEAGASVNKVIEAMGVAKLKESINDLEKVYYEQ